MRYHVLAAVAAAAVATTATAQPLQASYPTDASMDCAALQTEFVRMDTVIADYNQQIAGAQGAAKGAGLAGTVAIEGALRSGLLSRAPGLGMFANKAAGMAQQNAANKTALAQEQIKTAETRKLILNGIYMGKSCSAQPAAPAPAEAPVAAAQ